MNRNVLMISLSLLLLLVLASSQAFARGDDDGWLGVYTQDIDKDLIEAFDLKTDHGVIIKMVVSESPAEKAGLKQGDVILAFDGVKLTDADQLADLVGDHASGDQVEIDILRKGKKETIAVELGEREDEFSGFGKKWVGTMPGSKDAFKFFYQMESSGAYMGVSLDDLNSQLGEYFGVEKGKGALITEVMKDSPAEKAGLKAGDVIVNIDGMEVEGAADVKEIVMDTEEGDKIEVSVLRDRKQMEFSVEIEESPEDYFGMGNIVPGFDEDLIFLPKTKGLFRGDFDVDMPDMEELQEEMEALQRELKKMQHELQDIKTKLE